MILHALWYSHDYFVLKVGQLCVGEMSLTPVPNLYIVKCRREAEGQSSRLFLVLEGSRRESQLRSGAYHSARLA